MIKINAAHRAHAHWRRNAATGRLEMHWHAEFGRRGGAPAALRATRFPVRHCSLASRPERP